MPIYVYACPACDLEIEEMRPITEADAPMWCPVCGNECGRGITNFSAVARRARGEGAQTAATPTGTPIHRGGCLCC